MSDLPTQLDIIFGVNVMATDRLVFTVYRELMRVNQGRSRMAYVSQVAPVSHRRLGQMMVEEQGKVAAEWKEHRKCAFGSGLGKVE